MLEVLFRPNIMLAQPIKAQFQMNYQQRNVYALEPEIMHYGKNCCLQTSS